MRKVWTLLIAIILTITVIPIIIDIAPPAASVTIWYVDDIPGGSPSEDFITIQEAVDAAQPGDTVFVYAGIYYEDVTITKTINLTGEDRDTTIINSTNLIGIYVTNVDFVNISSFTVVNGSWAGIRLMPSNNSMVENIRVEMNSYGIQILDSNNTIITNNIASNNSDYDGIHISRSTNITVENNICINNKVMGIHLYEYDYDCIILNNLCINNDDGIHISYSDNNYIINNTLENNSKYVSSSYGIYIYNSNNNIISNNTLSENRRGIKSRWNSLNNRIINSTISNSISSDIEVSWNSNLLILNTSFNKTKTYFETIDSIIDVQWYLHVNVIDYLGDPVPNANIKIEDNINGSYNKTFTSDGNGYVRWVSVTEYIEQDTSGDNLGEKIYYTPHRIVAWNDTLVGYAFPEPFIDKSKTVNIVLYNGTLMGLEPGWNLISLPRPQSDTNLQTVLQSIEGHYDAVQWYNIIDINNQWKHHHVSKPSNLNDLNEINHTMGFWVHIIDKEGTTLVILGDELTLDQNISLYPGWNLVGYPSISRKLRNDALDNINYSDDVDAIWTFNATTRKWKEVGISDYFEVGQGYWMHSKVTKDWNVPL